MTVSRIAALWNPGNAGNAAQVKQLQEAITTLGPRLEADRRGEMVRRERFKPPACRIRSASETRAPTDMKPHSARPSQDRSSALDRRFAQ